MDPFSSGAGGGSGSLLPRFVAAKRRPSPPGKSKFASVSADAAHRFDSHTSSAADPPVSSRIKNLMSATGATDDSLAPENEKALYVPDSTPDSISLQRRIDDLEYENANLKDELERRKHDYELQIDHLGNKLSVSDVYISIRSSENID